MLRNLIGLAIIVCLAQAQYYTPIYSSSCDVVRESVSGTYVCTYTASFTGANAYYSIYLPSSAYSTGFLKTVMNATVSISSANRLAYLRVNNTGLSCRTNDYYVEKDSCSVTSYIVSVYSTSLSYYFALNATARNSYYGTTTLTVKFTTNINGSVSTMSPPSTNRSSGTIALIVTAVVVPIVGAVLIFITVYCCVKCQQRRNAHLNAGHELADIKYQQVLQQSPQTPSGMAIPPQSLPPQSLPPQSIPPQPFPTHMNQMPSLPYMMQPTYMFHPNPQGMPMPPQGMPMPPQGMPMPPQGMMVPFYPPMMQQQPQQPQQPFNTQQVPMLFPTQPMFPPQQPPQQN